MAIETGERRQGPGTGISEPGQEGAVPPVGSFKRRLIRLRQAISNPQQSAIANAPDEDPGRFGEFITAQLTDTFGQIWDATGRRIISKFFRRRDH